MIGKQTEKYFVFTVADHYYSSNRPCPLPAGADVSLPPRRDAIRLILRIDVGLNHATGRTRMVRRGSPRAIQQFHCTEPFQYDAAPVCRRTHWFQAALTFPAVLIAENTQFAGPIAT